MRWNPCFSYKHVCKKMSFYTLFITSEENNFYFLPDNVKIETKKKNKLTFKEKKSI